MDKIFSILHNVKIKFYLLAIAYYFGSNFAYFGSHILSVCCTNIDVILQSPPTLHSPILALHLHSRRGIFWMTCQKNNNVFISFFIPGKKRTTNPTSTIHQVSPPTSKRAFGFRVTAQFENILSRTSMRMVKVFFKRLMLL